MSDKNFATPVEAKNSAVIGGSALTLCGLEFMFLLLLDADHITRFLRKFKTSDPAISPHAEKIACSQCTIIGLWLGLLIIFSS